MIYLDHAATTPMRSEVMEVMRPYFSERFGNASSLHSYGLEARAAVERAREQVAQAIGANASEIIFTLGEPRQIIWRYAACSRATERGQII